MPLQVRDNTTWKPVNNLWVRNASNWQAVQVLWVMQWVPAGPIGEYNKVWQKVSDLRVPTTPVPNVSLNYGTSIIPPELRVSWTVVTNPNDAMYDASIDVQWYINGLHMYNDFAPQGNGFVTRFFNNGDGEIYARVRYYKNGTGGPWTNSNTMFV